MSNNEVNINIKQKEKVDETEVKQIRNYFEPNVKVGYVAASVHDNTIRPDEKAKQLSIYSKNKVKESIISNKKKSPTTTLSGVSVDNKSIKDTSDTKYCSYCGEKVLYDVVICPHCGCQVGYIKSDATIELKNIVKKLKSILVTLTKMFMIFGCVFSGFLIIPLIWKIPITKYYFKSIKYNQRLSIKFKVSSLIFVSPPAGILMLLF